MQNIVFPILFHPRIAKLYGRVHMSVPTVRMLITSRRSPNMKTLSHSRQASDLWTINDGDEDDHEKKDVEKNRR